MIFALGLPGAEVRAYLINCDPAPSLLVGEVSVALDAMPTRSAISADGLTVSPYVVPLAESKADKWAEAKVYRDTVVAGGCSTPSGRVQTDDASRLKVNGAVNNATLAKMAGAAFSIAWTMADNSIVTLNADGMIALGTAVGDFTTLCQSASTSIRTRIDGAADAHALAMIDITLGYPS